MKSQWFAAQHKMKQCAIGQVPTEIPAQQAMEPNRSRQTLNLLLVHHIRFTTQVLDGKMYRQEL